MLKQLVQYSEKRRLVGLGFAPKIVKWAVVLDMQGCLHGSIELGDPENPRNIGKEFEACPDLSQAELVAGKEKRSHFLVDSIATVLGWDDKKRNGTRRSEKGRFFIHLLREAAKACPETALFADCLEDETSSLALIDQLERSGARPTDKITVVFLGREPEFLLEDDVWHLWWSEYRKSLAKRPRKKRDRPMVSFISGEPVEPARTHPKITGLGDVGGAKTGAAVVSCDKDALCSYGLTQSLNSAMSEEEAAAYRAGLNHLLANHAHRVASTKIGYAYEEPIPDRDNPVRLILNPTGTYADDDTEPGTPEEAALTQRAALDEAERLMTAIENGRRSDLRENRFFSLALSGNSGRVVIRDWIQGRFDELLTNALAWFADLAIVRYDGASLAAPPKLGAVLASLSRNLKDVPAPLAAAVWRAAARRDPIPREALARAVDRFRADVAAERRLNQARAGLMKATLLRLRIPMGEYVNEYHPNPAYHCGRLVAVTVEAHSASLGRCRMECGRRYYWAASVIPSKLFLHLVEELGFHLSRLRSLGQPDDVLSFGFHLRNQTDAILEEIHDAGGPPGPLSLEDRCCFALGYYQQRAALSAYLAAERKEAAP